MARLLYNRIEITEVLFVNHSSILIKSGTKYLLTDPWYEKPAFGSWLPTFPSYVHPVYLASLGKNLTILISHGHDDHCDDKLLSLFDKETEIVTAHFSSPSVINRLKKLGFNNITTVNNDGQLLADSFKIKGYIDSTRSLDDAIYTINTGNGFIIHCNDNWFKFNENCFNSILNDRNQFEDKNIMFLTQTNSASGYPLNYLNYDNKEKISILKSKIIEIVAQGMENAINLKLSKIFSYAGFATIFVKDYPEYKDLGLTPTAKFIKNVLVENPKIKNLTQYIETADYYPGDILNLSTGNLNKAFISSEFYSDLTLKNISGDYYQKYGIIDNCYTFKKVDELDFNENKLDYFLTNFNQFVIQKVKNDNKSYETILNKSFEICIPDLAIKKKIVFGADKLLTSDELIPNKRLVVTSKLISQVLNGEILFENLYTGYEGLWERFPADVYNRDIIMMIVMYSYVYKNRLAKNFNINN